MHTVNLWNYVYLYNIIKEQFKLRVWTRLDVAVSTKYLNNKKIWNNCCNALP